MQIRYKEPIPPFLKYLTGILEEKGLTYRWLKCGNDPTLSISGDHVLEMICEGTKVSFWFFEAMGTLRSDVTWCEVVDLNDPGSVDTIMNWVNKINDSE